MARDITGVAVILLWCAYGGMYGQGMGGGFLGGIIWRIFGQNNRGARALFWAFFKKSA